MKKIYTFLILFAMTTTVLVAQNKDTKKADQLYDRLAYTDAAEEYKKLLKRNKGSRYVYEKLANCYYFINDTKKAATYYKRVIKGKKVDAEVVYNYAQSQKANGKFEDSNTWMKKFAEMKPNDSRAIAFMKNPDYLPKIIDGEAKFEVKNLKKLNSKSADFGGFMIGKDFYFASARGTGKKYKWNDEPYLDIYKASVVGGTIKNENALEGAINSKYHEANAIITQDGKRMYFDSNDNLKGKYQKSEDGVNQINLYYAEKVGGEWKDVKEVPFNSSEYSTGHPALSPDGNTLYFSSDKPGGKGQSDIYKVAIKKDGTFGTPLPVTEVNTEGKEVFPFVDSNGTLYLSSDAHLGMGGLDVFFAEADGSGFGEVIHLGNTINSKADDFAFKFDPATKEGYISSNRRGGKGSDDIYSVKQIEPLCKAITTITVYDATTKKPLSGARVDLYDVGENKLGTKTTDAEGNVVFDIECDKKHVAQAVLAEFESNDTDLSAASFDVTDVKGTIVLAPIEKIIKEDKIILNPIYFDYDKHNIRPQAAFELDKVVALMKKYPGMVVEASSHTDSRGNDQYNLELSERRAQATVQYIISQGIEASRINGKGYGETKHIYDCGDDCSEEQHDTNRRSEFTIIKK